MLVSPGYFMGVVKMTAETTELYDLHRVTKIFISTALYIFKRKSSCNIDINQIYLLDFVYIGQREILVIS